MRLLFAVLSLCLLGPCVAASAANMQWLQVKTDHFTVLTDGGDRQARHTAGQLERMHAAFAKLLPNATDDPGSRIVVLALRDRKDFQSVEPAPYLAKNALDLAGLFVRGENKNYILLRLDSTGDHPYATVYHEYTHYVMRHADFVPLWLNEGLAQFYQNTDFSDHSVRVGQPDANEILFLREKRLLPLATLFAVDYNSPYYHEEDKGNIFYAESWALTHFLFLQDFGRPESRIRTYALRLSEGQSPLLAAQNAFGDLNQLQSALSRYINSGNYQALAMPLENAVDERVLKVEPIADAEVNAVRADVLARNGRTEEAIKLNQAVLAETPESSQAHESMGMIKLREGDMTAAKRWFGEAAALHSDDFLTFYYAGALAWNDPSASDASQHNLHECLRLNPRFAPAMVSLSQLDAREGKLDEAMSLSLQAVQSDPRNLEYRLDAAEIRVARKELDAAVSVLQAAARLAHTPEEKTRVEARLSEVRSYQDAVARQEKAETAAMQGGNVRPATKELAASPASGSHGGATELRDKQGKLLRSVVFVEPDHEFPATSKAGSRHVVRGTVRQVSCFAPKGLLLTVEGVGKPMTLYSNDMYGVAFTAGNFTPKGELNPCLDFDGLQATVTYGLVDDPTVQGQILSMELNR